MGTDRWLMSDAFGRTLSRSLAAEAAIAEATRLQMLNHPNANDVALAHQELVNQLAENDEFWPMWIYFAEQHGVKL